MPGSSLEGSSDLALIPPVRVAIVGCTLAHIRYGAVLKRCEFLTVAALVDADARLARGWARELGKPAVFADLASLLASDVAFDAAIVALPPPERVSAIGALLRARKSVLCDPPFAPRLADTDGMLQAAGENGVVLMPAFARRFDPYFEQTGALLNAGEIGAFQQVRCVWSFPPGGWFAAENGGDPEDRNWVALLPQIACQTVDVCHGWLGTAHTVSADIDRPAAQALAQRRGQTALLANIIVSHDVGQATHHLSRARSVHPAERYVLTGSSGSLELLVSAGETNASTRAPALVLHRPGQRDEPIPVDAAPNARIDGLLRHFAARARGAASPRVDGTDARAAQEIVSAAYLSTQDSLKVSLPLRANADASLA